MQYRKWLNHWLENYIQPSAKQRTYIRYLEIVNQHIAPALGDLDLSELTATALQCFITEQMNSGNLITGRGLAPNSVNAIISVMQNSIKAAYELGYTSDYIADKIKRPKTHEKKVECFCLTEQKNIERYITSHNKPKMLGIIICLYTGLRIGELLALEWTDIDFIKNELSVNKTCNDGKDKNGVFTRITDSPKTQSSNRTIPIPKQLMPLLREAKRKSRSIYVISNGEKPISIRSYQRSFSALQKKLNIAHKGFHSLRHTFATRALECGMDVKTLSEILGHKNPTVTLNRYAHSLMEHKRAMMNNLGKLL